MVCSTQHRATLRKAAATFDDGLRQQEELFKGLRSATDSEVEQGVRLAEEVWQIAVNEYVGSDQPGDSTEDAGSAASH